MRLYAYCVFHCYTIEGGVFRELCGIFCTLGQAQEHCQSHPQTPDVTLYIGKIPIWGFPWKFVVWGAWMLGMTYVILKVL